MRQLFLTFVTGALLLCLTSSASAQQYKLGVGMTPAAGGGVNIVNVISGSVAENLGLRSGQIILSVDGRLVSDPITVRDYVMDPARNSVNLIYQDGGAFYEVHANFAVVTAAAPGTITYGKSAPRKVKPGSVTKKRVADPRKR